MLKKENRLKSRKEFELVKLKGRMRQTRFFGWLEMKMEGGGKKFGMIVSKRISDKAVDRNRIRRRLAEAIKNNLGGVEEGMRVVILGKKEIMNIKEREIETEVQKILKDD